MGNEQEKKFVFKVAKFEHTSKSNNKKRAWRSLKQILTMERALIWPDDAVLYYSINAPPSFKPNRKYSDISGLMAPYTDPYSKLFYANVDEYATIQKLPMDISAGYLQLRGASSII
ncbi:INO80 complex subunit C [Arctopsyche grandis]|uniref:INO80 complex subunit C n=1 Tax=Arctopsyche grandis TaxID=121162 RepID=UPI00406D7ABE